MNDPEALREAVRAYLRSHSLPQPTLAKELGVSVSWLSKFVRGELNNPTVSRLSTLSRWIEIDRYRGTNRGAA